MLLAVALLLAAPQKNATFAITDPSGVLDLSGLWLFQAGDNPVFAQPTHDDSRWDQRRIPAGYLQNSFRWAGFAWYRIHLEIDAAVVGSDLMLSLGPAREAVEVYVNGSLVAERGRFGSRPQGGTRLMPLLAVIPAGLLRAGDNVLAVRVYDPTWNGGLVSGPLLIGAPLIVRARLANSGTSALMVSVGTALIALCIGLGQLLGRPRTQRGADIRWLAFAAFCFAVFHASGSGILESILPNLDLALRLAWIAAWGGIVGMTAFFAARDAERFSVGIPIRGIVLTAGAAIILLMPERWVFYAVRPMLLCASLAGALYAAGITAREVRREEHGSLVVFGSMLVLVFLIIGDAIAAQRTDVLPPVSAIGAVAVLVIATFVNVRQAAHDHDALTQRVQALEKALDDRSLMGILDATALSIRNANAFLDVAIREAALELRVRRCSLVLAQPDGSLRIEAAVGLPKHVTSSPVQLEGSIAGWVFQKGEGLSATSLPVELQALRRSRGAYLTDAFISQPVQIDGRTIGVLNVSDKNDARPFAPSDEITVQEVCTKIALVLQRVV